MPLVKLERLIGFPPCHVWAVLSDFGAFQDWAMGGAGSSKVEGDGPGMVRLLDVPGLGEIAECLDKLDNENMHLTYSLLHGNPLGMSSYTANVQLTPEPINKCKISWHGEFMPMPGNDPITVGQSLKASYVTMTEALTAFLKESLKKA